VDSRDILISLWRRLRSVGPDLGHLGPVLDLRGVCYLADEWPGAGPSVELI
jgi:hypothetical protein